MDVRAVVLVVLEGINAHIAVVVERSMVAVALVEVHMTDGQFGIIHLANIHIISADGLHRVGIDAVDVDLVEIYLN